MKKILFLFSIAILAISGCAKETDSGSIIDESTVILTSGLAEYKSKYENASVGFVFHTTNEEALIKSKLDINIDKDVHTLLFDVNEEAEGYKFFIHDAAINAAEKIKARYTLEELETLTGNLKQFGKNIVMNSVGHNFKLIQAIYFHNAILNIAKRSLESNTDCNCTPDPAYYVGKTGFWCQEDVEIDPEKIISVIEKRGDVLSGSNKILFDYLKLNRDKKAVRLDVLNNILTDKIEFNQRVEASKRRSLKLSNPVTLSSKKGSAVQAAAASECMEGSDIGCCGNYSGCCWFDSNFCFWHDIYCYCCTEWYCTGFCKPETGCKVQN